MAGFTGKPGFKPGMAGGMGKMAGALPVARMKSKRGRKSKAKALAKKIW
jgi:hypothetical protein